MLPADNELRQRTTRSLFVMLLLVLAAGCTIIEPKLDRGKFAELNRTSQALRATFSAGDHCQVPETLLQRMTLGTTALKDRTASKAERDLLAAYEQLTAITQDAQLLCRSRGQLANFQFVPAGRIYVSQELDPIVERYDLAVERHLYKPTGASWKSVSVGSIGEVWEKAAAVMRQIEVMLKYG